MDDVNIDIELSGIYMLNIQRLKKPYFNMVQIVKDLK